MGKAINYNGKYHKKLTIGLFGFGVVGEGLYKALQQTSSLNATIKKVCIKHPGKKRKHPYPHLKRITQTMVQHPIQLRELKTLK